MDNTKKEKEEEEKETPTTTSNKEEAVCHNCKHCVAYDPKTGNGECLLDNGGGLFIFNERENPWGCIAFVEKRPVSAM